MVNHLNTKRLQLSPLNSAEAEFIFELLNTTEWKKFIGDRNISTVEQAAVYIEKINGTPNVQYWIVKLLGSLTSIGIVTFIKRDYLEHHDIGFAFLSQYLKKGYAHEATQSVLSEIVLHPLHSKIQATTLRANESSIRLLEKLGLRFLKEIVIENEKLLVYEASVDKLLL